MPVRSSLRQCATPLKPQGKVKRHDTVEVIVGGVLGPVQRPEVVIAGRYTAEGEEHPWPEEIGTGRWAKTGQTVPLTKVAPHVVAEVTADAALQAGAWPHPLRYVRHRPDLQPVDVDRLR
jgi:hypothetical protein